MQKIWDIYLRLFHWLFALSIIISIISAEENTDIHYFSAQFITFLLIFRLIWGIIGYPTARFKNFFPTLAKIKQYLTGTYHAIGHNPVGSISVFVMLGLVGLQITTGLFTTDEVLFEAPFYASVSSSMQELLQEVHEGVGEFFIIVIAIHISAIVLYKLIGTNLVKDMVDGGNTQQIQYIKYMHAKAILAMSISALATHSIFY